MSIRQREWQLNEAARQILSRVVMAEEGFRLDRAQTLGILEAIKVNLTPSLEIREEWQQDEFDVGGECGADDST